MGCIVSDLRKECDYINRGILLLSKLEQYRIIGKFKAWLNPTSQRDTRELQYILMLIIIVIQVGN